MSKQVLDLAFNWPVGEGRFNMTENDKNDLKVPRFDSLNKALSRDSRIKVWTQAVKCASLSRFGMKGAALFQALHNTSDSRQVG
jgi:hypothetical protein